MWCLFIWVTGEHNSAVDCVFSPIVIMDNTETHAIPCSPGNTNETTFDPSDLLLSDICLFLKPDLLPEMEPENGDIRSIPRHYFQWGPPVKNVTSCVVVKVTEMLIEIKLLVCWYFQLVLDVMPTFL